MTFFIFVCTSVCVCTHSSMHMLWHTCGGQRTSCSDQFFCHVGTWDRTQVTKLASKHPNPVSHLVSLNYLLLIGSRLTENSIGGLATDTSCIQLRCSPAHHQGPVWDSKMPMEVMDRKPVYGADTKHTEFRSPTKATKSIHHRGGATQSGKKNDASWVCLPASPLATTGQVQSDSGDRKGGCT